MLTKEERHQLLFEFNNTNKEYTDNKTIIELFEEQVSRTPDYTALVFEGIKFSYRELNEHANQLGCYLRTAYLVKPDDLIIISMDRSARMMVAILGILKSGAAYVPIDPEYPTERIAYIKEDTYSKLMIDDAFLDSFEKIKEGYSKENLLKINTAENLVYVIYTSGTTGLPKGVMIENKSLVNYIYWCLHEYGGSSFLLFSSISFDLTVTSMYVPLLSGKCIFIEKSGNFDFISNVNPEVEAIKLTPSHLDIFNHYYHFPKNKIKNLILGGEAVTQKLNISYPDIENVYNEYGPTECTVGCIAINLKKYYNSEIIPIGRPIFNTQVYILSEEQDLLPVGVSGKIYLSGAGLSRGYLNKPELTQEKFIDNPFILGKKMYDTGDIGRWLPDGNIEFIGRKDDQVKLRGYRIEFGEIEKYLSDYSSEIKQAVIDIREVNEEQVLVAYYTTINKSKINKSALREYLLARLPSYMIPNYFIEQESIPLSVNGKIDRKALPEINKEYVVRKKYVAPRNEIEQQLVEIWKEVLKQDEIGIMDNFFELGGDSLLALEITFLLKKKLNININWGTMMRNQDIGNLYNYLCESNLIDDIKDYDIIDI